MSGPGYHRRKNPEQVRAALLSEAQALAAGLGMPGVTLQAVASAAGVTKGGLLHHFPNREALIEAVCAATIASYEAALERHMAADPEPYGRFSRAYIRACLAGPDAPDDGPAPQLMAALWSDPGLRARWYHWMSDLEARHAATDGARSLKLARLAADGLWIALTDGQEGGDWLEDLLAATRRS